MSAVRRTAVATVAALAALAPVATSTAQAAPSARAEQKVSIVAENRFSQGQDVDVHAFAGFDRKGVVFDRATVVGPHGIRARLTPAADAGVLVGTVHVPRALKGTWIRLTLITPDGHRASTIVRHA